MARTPCTSSFSWLKALTLMGTSKSFSARLCAVTTISSNPELSSCASAPPAASAEPRMPRTTVERTETKCCMRTPGYSYEAKSRLPQPFSACPPPCAPVPCCCEKA
jgi:hypothetical protein